MNADAGGRFHVGDVQPRKAAFPREQYYFETGNLAHTAQNKTNLRLRVLAVEILPKDWTAPAMIAPRSQ
jgi:hypothetical protein